MFEEKDKKCHAAEGGCQIEFILFGLIIFFRSFPFKCKYTIIIIINRAHVLYTSVVNYVKVPLLNAFLTLL